MNKSPMQFLKRPIIGTYKGKPIRRKRSWRGFFICLIAGGRSIVMNVGITGTIEISNPEGAIISGCNIERAEE